ncbi:MAG: type II secretion system major pseudopilin GspG [Victivallales bacterium]|nr:type II secretion system major pseudopilin GspG [Victivallales bacterium]
MKKSHHQSGRRYYTMMEMVIVIVIIGLLTAIATPLYMKHMKRAKVNTAQTQIRMLEQAIFDFQLDMKRLPGADHGLQELEENVTNDENWNGPYIRPNVPQDPWGGEYIYTVPGEKGDFDLASYGSDKQPGGNGDAADITNWGKN